MHFVILVIDIYLIDTFLEYCSGLCNSQRVSWMTFKNNMSSTPPTAKVINNNISIIILKIMFMIILVIANKL